MVAMRRSNQHYWVGPLPPIRGCLQRDRVMLITVCRLYDSYADANRNILMLEAAGLPPSETSVISNNSDTWYSATKTANVAPFRREGRSRRCAN